MLIRKRIIAALTGVSLGLTLVFSGTTWVAPQPTVHAATATTKANAIIAKGKTFMGTPYKYGAKSGITSVFDCSSFVQYLYKQQGISLPRSSIQQSKVGTYVSKSNLKPGDLVFFYSPVHHVAIYIGNGKILHTYGKPGVIISNLNSGTWKNNYNTARRVISSSSSTVKATSNSSSKATIVKSVSFRTGASTSNSRIRYLSKGETVTIISKVNAYWYKVRDKNGRTGYVSSLSKYIRT